MLKIKNDFFKTYEKFKVTNRLLNVLESFQKEGISKKFTLQTSNVNNKLEWNTSVLFEKMSEDARNAYIKYTNIPKSQPIKVSTLAQKIRGLFNKKKNESIIQNTSKINSKEGFTESIKNNEILLKKNDDLSEMTEAESSENIKNNINDSKSKVRVFMKKNSFSNPNNMKATLYFQKIPQIFLDQELDF